MAGQQAAFVLRAPGVADSGQQDSLHGENAARRQAITELLFFASVGDLHRCRKIIQAWGLNVKDPATADYDKRTPLHLASAEGAFSVVLWLLDHGADVNAIDRFKRTPLEDAVRGDHGEVATLLVQRGGKVVDKAGQLVDLSDSPLAGNVRIFTDYDPEWEIDPVSLQLLDKIGEGEFGVVYKGNWNGTVVAVKVLKEAGAMAMGDFRTELNVLQKVHHPHTVQFLGAVTKQQPFMIVTEYMCGGSLADLFKGARFPNLWRSVQIALDMARGMAYLHSRTPQAVIHRDLKPANLMLGGPKIYSSYHKQLCWEETGVMKIADFGLSKSLKLAKPRRKDNRHSLEGNNPYHTPDSSVAAGSANNHGKATESYKLTGETGSYRYMAPEVFRHEPYNNKVDVYSFGMICFQLFEGVPPFWNMDPVEAARAAAMKGARPQWGAVNRHEQVVFDKLKRLVEMCWSGEYESRPEFVDVVDMLEQAALEVKREDKRQGSGTGSGKGAALGGVPGDKSPGACCSVM